EREAKRAGIKKVISKVGPFDDFVGELAGLLHGKKTAIGPLGLSDNYAENEPPADLANGSDTRSPGKTPKDGSRP
ncbi:MAG TPA: hypothetical protein VJS43_10020, partial [Candidatus Acidoferrales bacterium]|nr:hypothetical protein [Candidatus Acidoferrales bacterium]